MRIISGKYRGRILNSPSSDGVRPTGDKVKESVFNMIQYAVCGASFLDLFAGSGAMGIEAISRGAEKAVFVDIAKSSLDTVRANLALINEKATLINADYETALRKLSGEKFDIIYIDPPFKDRCISRCLELIEEYRLLEEDGMVIYESLREDNEKAAVSGFTLVKEKKYGTVMIDVYERAR